MKSESSATIIILLISLVIAFILYSANESQWNNGYCSCGGKWVYQEAVGHRYNTTYVYKCDKCGKLKEFYSLDEETQK